MGEVAKKMEHIHLISIKSNIDVNSVYDLSENVSQAFQENPLISDIVIDFKGQFSIKQDSIRSLSSFALELRKKIKKLYLLNFQKDLKDMLVKMALDDLLIPIDSLNQIEHVVPKKKPAIDVNFLNPFIEGTMKTLSVQCNMNCKPLSPKLKTPAFKHPIDIAGVIGVSSKGFMGSIAICFPKEIFLKIMSNMLGEEFSEIDEDLEDGAGELLNIIFGHAKKVLNQTGHSLDKAIPAIVRGSALNVRHITSHACFILPFETDFGSFYIEISAEL